MKLLEAAPPELAEKIRRYLLPGEEEQIRVVADLAADGWFGSQWVVVTRERLLVVPPAGDDGVLDLPLRDISAVRTETLVGGGCLEVTRKEAATLRVHYSASLSLRFAEVARGIEQLRRGEPLLVPGEVERVRCDRCGRLLPEKNGICPACIRRWATLRRIAAYLKPYRGRVLVLALTSVLMTSSTLLSPLITRQIVDDVLLPQGEVAQGLDERFTLLGLLVLGLLGVRVLSWGAEWVHGWIVIWLGARVTADVRSQLYRQLEMLSVRFHDRRAVGALMSRVTNDTGTLEHFLIRGLPHLLINAITLLGILGFMFWMSWPLALAVFLPVPAICAWGFFFWRRMSPLLHRWLQAGAKLSARLSEVLSGIRVVKGFAQEKREIARFEVHNRELLRVTVDTNRRRALLLATTGLLTGLGMLALWLFGGAKVLEGDLTVGTLVAFYSYLWLFYGPLQWFGQVNSWMTQAFAGAERIFEVLDAPPEVPDDPNAVAMPRLAGRVTFQKVTFGYDRAVPVLHDVKLDVAPGESIGIVGRSGAGKTTAMNLLCRFYDVDHNRIDIDGVDIRKIRLADLRSQISIVPQEPFLFSGTIAENISYGRPAASFEEVISAARAANAHGFILAKPDGYDTEVGERGQHLSGGERQRLAIARALLRDPRILILDEATSSVDAHSEKLIQEAIQRLARSCTTFFIAHRLSTVRHADRFVVLDNGRVAETGTYEELMALRGIFHELVRLQQAAPETTLVQA